MVLDIFYTFWVYLKNHAKSIGFHVFDGIEFDVKLGQRHSVFFFTGWHIALPTYLSTKNCLVFFFREVGNGLEKKTKTWKKNPEFFLSFFFPARFQPLGQKTKQFFVER